MVSIRNSSSVNNTLEAVRLEPGFEYQLDDFGPDGKLMESCRVKFLCFTPCPAVIIIRENGQTRRVLRARLYISQND